MTCKCNAPPCTQDKPSCSCGTQTVYTPPNNCYDNVTQTNNLRLFTLKCGTWVYSGELRISSTPVRGMRLMWQEKAYTIEQATLTSTEPGTDKWEVMLIQCGPSYYNNVQQKHTCSNNPCGIALPAITQPPIEPSGGMGYNSACTDPWYPPIEQPHTGQEEYPYTPRPVEMGLGCGPHYECAGYPH